MRDYQKTKCYSWENLHIHSRDKSLVPYDQVQSLIDYVWLSEGLEYAPRVKPLPKQCKRAAARANRLFVEIPKQGVTTTVLLHELSHSLTTDFDGKSNLHGARFVGVFITLLEKYAGFNRLELMYTAASAGVDYNFKGRVI